MTYAFPHNTVVVDKEGGMIENHRGMELRDYFAAKAMQPQIYIGIHDAYFLQCAERSYKIADAMLVAREK